MGEGDGLVRQRRWLGHLKEVLAWVMGGPKEGLGKTLTILKGNVIETCKALIKSYMHDWNCMVVKIMVKKCFMNV